MYSDVHFDVHAASFCPVLCGGAGGACFMFHPCSRAERFGSLFRRRCRRCAVQGLPRAGCCGSARHIESGVGPGSILDSGACERELVGWTAFSKVVGEH